MGRPKHPTERIRIKLELYKKIEERANKAGHEISRETEQLIEWSLENKDKLSTIHMLGDILPIVEDYIRLKDKRRK